MDDFNDYTIYQQQYIDLLREDYNKPTIDLVDDNDNFIHPTAIIGTNVQLGKGNYIGANCYIVGDVKIGDNNHLEAFCSIGTFPEHRSFFKEKKMKGVVIGNNNVFREFITINSGCYRDTKIGSDVWLQRGCYVGHDSEVCDESTLSINVIIGGHTSIGYSVNMGIGAICHQFSVIGSGAMVGMGAIITKTSQIEPLGTYVGNPCRFLKKNSYKIYRLTENQINHFSEYYKEQKSIMEEIKKSI